MKIPLFTSADNIKIGMLFPDQCSGTGNLQWLKDCWVEFPLSVEYPVKFTRTLNCVKVPLFIKSPGKTNVPDKGAVRLQFWIDLNFIHRGGFAPLSTSR